LLSAMADSMADAVGSGESSGELPELVPCEGAGGSPPSSPPSVVQESQPLDGSVIHDSPSFPLSPPPPLTGVTLHEDSCATPYPPQYPSTLTPSQRNFRLDYDATLSSIYRLNALTNFLVGAPDRVVLAGGGHVDRQDVVEACKTLRSLLERMFDRLQCID
jgi:hypothetical protein